MTLTPILDEYKKTLGNGPAEARAYFNRTDDFNWCAAQLCLMYSKAGLYGTSKQQFIKSTWVYKHAQQFQYWGRLYLYKDVQNHLVPDCIIIRNNDRTDDRADHIQVFEKYEDSKTKIVTIGGNEKADTATSLVRRASTSKTDERLQYVGYPAHVTLPPANPYMGEIATHLKPSLGPRELPPAVQDPLLAPAMESHYRIEGTVIKRPTEFSISRYNITDLRRLADGAMAGDLLAKKRKFFFTYDAINSQELNRILNTIWNINEVFFEFTYVESNVEKTATVYVGSIPSTLGRTGGRWVWRDVSFNLIEK